MCVLSVKVPIRKSLETYLMILVYVYETGNRNIQISINRCKLKLKCFIDNRNVLRLHKMNFLLLTFNSLN